MKAKILLCTTIIFLFFTPSLLQADESAIEEFIQRLYLNVFEQEGDEAGVTYWKNTIQSGATATKIAKYFYRSPQINALDLSDEEFIFKIYQTFFNRLPDEEGFNYWLSKIQQNEAQKDYIFYRFALSDEFNLLTKLSDIAAYDQEDQANAFIERFYNFVLQRRADETGVIFWRGQLLSQALTSLDIAKSFFLSHEYVEKNVTGREFIQTLYNTLMDREAEEEGLLYWLTQLENNLTREALLEIFVNTPEFKIIESNYLFDNEPFETFTLSFDEDFLHKSSKFYTVKCYQNDSNNSFYDIGKVAFIDGRLDTDFTGIEDTSLLFEILDNQLIAASKDNQLTMTFTIHEAKELFTQVIVIAEIEGYGEIEQSYEWWFINEEIAEIFLNQRKKQYQDNPVCSW